MRTRVSKFTISMPEDLLAEIDADAAARGETRSGIIREASVGYLAGLQEDSVAAARRRAVLQAVQLMKDLASEPCLDDRPSLEILRELRETDGLGKPADASAGTSER
jgi:hypothetical protein